MRLLSTLGFILSFFLLATADWSDCTEYDEGPDLKNPPQEGVWTSYKPAAYWNEPEVKLLPSNGVIHQEYVKYTVNIDVHHSKGRVYTYQMDINLVSDQSRNLISSKLLTKKGAGQ
jgi:hypothetical protein